MNADGIVIQGDQKCLLFFQSYNEMPAKKKGKKKEKGGGSGNTDGEEGGGKANPTDREQELRKE